jgi:ABC-2 type transport system ATP-binding protein
MIASLYGIGEDKAVPRIWQFLNLFELEEDTLTKKLLGTYSKGTRRKIVIIAALLHNPAVVLLDEPLDGLDPNAAVGFKALLESLAREGKTIVYSSHILDVVERVCDRVAVMAAGKLQVEGTPSELLAAYEMDTLESLFTRLTGQKEIEVRAQVFARSMSS